MSRIAKDPVVIPESVTVSVTVFGPISSQSNVSISSVNVKNSSEQLSLDKPFPLFQY